MAMQIDGDGDGGDEQQQNQRIAEHGQLSSRCFFARVTLVGLSKNQAMTFNHGYDTPALTSWPGSYTTVVDATAAQRTAVIDLSAGAARRAGPYLGGLLIGAVSFSR